MILQIKQAKTFEIIPAKREIKMGVVRLRFLAPAKYTAAI